MKKGLIPILTFFVIRSLGASVAWDILGGGGGREGNNWVGSYIMINNDPLEVSPGVYVYPNLCITATKQGNIVSISGDPEKIVTAYGDSWVRMTPGDLVDASTTRNQSAYFMHGWLDGEDGNYDLRADDPIEASYYSSFEFCLGFATAADYTPATYPYDPWKYVYYGWATFSYNRGEITLLHSALNTEGGGIYAGTDRTTSVPEPASCALAFLGTVLLLRRRRN